MENELFNFIGKYMPLKEEEKKAITDLNIFKTVKKGTVLLKEGEISGDYYFVIKGCIRCYYIIDGEEKTTAFYTELESFAPQSSTNKTPSQCYIACVEDSILSIANADMEKDIFEKFPRFETLCRLLSEDLLEKSQLSLDSFKTSTPEQRYLNLLNTRPDLVQRVPQQQLASYLGITRESLSRIRKRLQQQEKS